MTTKHTPAPWKTFSPNSLLNIPIGNDKITVAFTSIDLEKRGLSEANAKLIAAAPDLLEAALQIKNEIDTEGLLQRSYEKLLEAIKKATG